MWFVHFSYIYLLLIYSFVKVSCYMTMFSHNNCLLSETHLFISFINKTIITTTQSYPKPFHSDYTNCFIIIIYTYPAIIDFLHPLSFSWKLLNGVRYCIIYLMWKKKKKTLFPSLSIWNSDVNKEFIAFHIAMVI